MFLLYFVYFSPSLNLRVSILSQLVPIRNWNREPTIWTCIIWTPSLGREEQRNNRDFFLNFLLSPFARLRNGVLLKQQRIINPSKKRNNKKNRLMQLFIQQLLVQRKKRKIEITNQQKRKPSISWFCPLSAALAPLKVIIVWRGRKSCSLNQQQPTLIFWRGCKSRSLKTNQTWHLKCLQCQIMIWWLRLPNFFKKEKKQTKLTS